MMHLTTPAFFLSIAALIPLAAASVPGDPSGLWQPFAGVYKIHSGGVADRVLATPQDRRLTVNFDGKVAREVFDSLGPDLATTCSGETGDRAREKKGITCVYTAQDAKSKEGPYRCWIGLSLKTGESIPTSSC
jgi:hypothetical protein